MDRKKYESILRRVEKPARYIGGEKNSIIKDFENTDVRFAFCFPDVYEVGMSHIGLQVIYYLTNSNENFLCERVFAPWTDMGEQIKENNLKLFSLENKRALDEFDIVGFTLQYEMSYSNILYMLDLGGIKLLKKDRANSDPLVIAGGPCAYNPEPLADFIDLFIIGEGEEVNLELFELYRKYKLKGFDKHKFLLDAAKIQGIYVPEFYDVLYNDDGTIKKYEKKYEFLPEKIKKRYVSDFDKTFELNNLIVPYIETVHQRNVVEIFRGCTKGCRFCEAGYIYRPVRERNTDKIVSIVDKQIKNTGYNEVSLSSLSSCDYRELYDLVDTLMLKNDKKKVRISLPSLRLDTISIDVLKKIETVRKTGLTLAPEAGSQKMRDVINKNISMEDYTSALKSIFSSGWSRIKLYFMIGLPSENYEDLDGIYELGEIAKRLFFDRPKEEIKGNFQVTLSASCFVPKPFTPFQWLSQNTVDEFKDKIYYIKNQVHDKKIKFQYHDPKLSVLEGYISRGDRKIGRVILRAYENGAKFDGWSDEFQYDIWKEAIDDENLPMENYNFRSRDLNEVFPWDIIDIGVSKDYFIKELEKSKIAKLTKDCRNGCNNCGIENCEMRSVFR